MLPVLDLLERNRPSVALLLLTNEASEGMTILTPAGIRCRLSYSNGQWTATEVTP